MFIKDIGILLSFSTLCVHKILNTSPKCKKFWIADSSFTVQNALLNYVIHHEVQKIQGQVLETFSTLPTTNTGRGSINLTTRWLNICGCIKSDSLNKKVRAYFDP